MGPLLGHTLVSDNPCLDLLRENVCSWTKATRRALVLARIWTDMFPSMVPSGYLGVAILLFETSYDLLWMTES
jgi:hypothetical protein